MRDTGHPPQLVSARGGPSAQSDRADARFSERCGPARLIARQSARTYIRSDSCCRRLRLCRTRRRRARQQNIGRHPALRLESQSNGGSNPPAPTQREDANRSSAICGPNLRCRHVPFERGAAPFARELAHRLALPLSAAFSGLPTSFVITQASRRRGSWVRWAKANGVVKPKQPEANAAELIIS